MFDGGAMAAFQAAGSLALFTGVEPDVDRMLAHLGQLAAEEVDHRAYRVPLGNRIRLVACRHSVPQAACVYSLIRPLRTGLRRICRV
jgi:hypothetical protein